RAQSVNRRWGAPCRPAATPAARATLGERLRLTLKPLRFNENPKLASALLHIGRVPPARHRSQERWDWAVPSRPPIHPLYSRVRPVGQVLPAPFSLFFFSPPHRP